MWSYFSAIERVYNRLRIQNPVYLDTVNGCNERMWRNWSWEVLTDESQCNIFRARGFYRVYRGTDQRSSRSCVRQVDRKSGSLVMIKDAILYGWRSKLVFIEGKVAANSFNNTIFNTQVTTYMLRYLHTWKKNRPSCRGCLCTQLYWYQYWEATLVSFFTVNTPIEHSWDHVDRRTWSGRHAPKNWTGSYRRVASLP